MQVSLSDAAVPLVALLMLVYLFRRRRSSCAGIKRPPCLHHLPIVGSLPFLIGDPIIARKLVSYSLRLGNVFAFYAGTRYVVVLNGRSAIYNAFVMKAAIFSDRTPNFVENKYINNKSLGLVMSHFHEQYVKRRHRTMSILKELGFGSRAVETLIHAELRDFLEAVSRQDSSPFDPGQLIFRCIIGVIAEFMFGQRFDHETDRLCRHMPTYMDSMNRCFNPLLELFPFLRHLPHFGKQIRHMERMHRIAFDMFDEYVRHCLELNQDSLVSMYFRPIANEHRLMNDDHQLDREDLKYIIRDLLAAGTETTTTSLKWAIVQLANHLDAQANIQLELDNLYGNTDRLPALSDAAHLPHLEATILEVLRYHASLPLAIPRNTLVDTELNGMFIPRDTMVIGNLFSANMDPVEWTNPTEFCPERFIGSSGQVIGKDKVVSFSMGKRSCVGELLARQEMFLLLAAMLRQFHIRPPEGHSHVVVEESVGMVISPTPFAVRMIPRNR